MHFWKSTYEDICMNPTMNEHNFDVPQVLEGGVLNKFLIKYKTDMS